MRVTGVEEIGSPPVEPGAKASTIAINLSGEGLHGGELWVSRGTTMNRNWWRSSALRSVKSCRCRIRVRHRGVLPLA